MNTGTLRFSSSYRPGITLFLLCFASLLSGQDNRIESEFKLAVPEGQEEAIWSFLLEELTGNALLRFDTAFTSTTSEEIFHDTYFDSPDEILASNQAGVRYRERYINDTLEKTLVQLKLPTGDTSGVARREIKFNPYTKVKLDDREAMHPFWRYIKPKDRDEVDLYLGTLQLQGANLHPELKLRQSRRRVYVAQNGQPFLTATLDRVSYFFFPYPSFTELELELNEILYTEANFEERANMERINQEIRDQLFARFPDLVQDQTPKYNKMRNLISGNPLVWISNNLMYILLSIVMLTAIVVFLRNR